MGEVVTVNLAANLKDIKVGKNGISIVFDNVDFDTSKLPELVALISSGVDVTVRGFKKEE